MSAMQYRTRTVLFILPLALAITAGLWLLRLERLSARVCSQTLRLHVVANSDSIQDQLCKLRARDAVLEQAALLLDGADSLPDAAARLQAGQTTLEQAARRAVEGNQDVRVLLQEQRYPATYWNGCRLPAGQYLALRVELGRGAGHNWFCVLYPSLGASGAKGGSSLPGQDALVCGKYELRLAAWELLEKAQAWLESKKG